MLTIKNTDFTSNLPLASILSVMTKVQMLDICKKLELYVSPNPFGLELSRFTSAVDPDTHSPHRSTGNHALATSPDDQQSML